MLGFGFLGGKGRTEKEAFKISAKCGARVSAVRVCLQANSGGACENFQQDLDLCKVRSATPYNPRPFEISRTWESASAVSFLLGHWDTRPLTAR